MDEASSCVLCPDYKMCKGKGQYLLWFTFYPQPLKQSRCSIGLCFLFPLGKHGRPCSWTDGPSLSLPLVGRADSTSPGRDHMLQHNLPEEKRCNERTLNTFPAINKITPGFPFGCCFMGVYIYQTPEHAPGDASAAGLGTTLCGARL